MEINSYFSSGFSLEVINTLISVNYSSRVAVGSEMPCSDISIQMVPFGSLCLCFSFGVRFHIRHVFRVRIDCVTDGRIVFSVSDRACLNISLLDNDSTFFILNLPLVDSWWSINVLVRSSKTFHISITSGFSIVNSPFTNNWQERSLIWCSIIISLLTISGTLRSCTQMFSDHAWINVWLCVLVSLEVHFSIEIYFRSSPMLQWLCLDFSFLSDWFTLAIITSLC